MKIDNKRLFLGDLHQEDKNYAILKCKDVPLVLFGFKYVPIWHIKNIFSYLGLRSHVRQNGTMITNPDHRFLDVHPTLSNNFHESVTNLRPLFEEEGKTSLRKLHEIEDSKRKEFEFDYEI